tara:strand:+ start:500 stop:757 length:258 start_codon:yes stop_codon:yes gene_type:complete
MEKDNSELKKRKKPSRFSQIVNGYSNLVKSKLGLSSEQDEKIFEARRSICNACPEKTILDRCGACGCPLAAKTRSMETECPKKHW